MRGVPRMYIPWSKECEGCLGCTLPEQVMRGLPRIYFVLPIPLAPARLSHTPLVIPFAPFAPVSAGCGGRRYRGGGTLGQSIGGVSQY